MFKDVSAPLGDILAQLLVHQPQNLLVVRKENMGAAEVEGITVFNQAAAVTTRNTVEFQYFALVFAASARDHQPYQAATEYANSHPQPRPCPSKPPSTV
jgi:hypothetical protein